MSGPMNNGDQSIDRSYFFNHQIHNSSRDDNDRSRESASKKKSSETEEERLMEQKWKKD
jgi:hypothetical protein